MVAQALAGGTQACSGKQPKSSGESRHSLALATSKLGQAVAKNPATHGDMAVGQFTPYPLGPGS